MNDVRLKDAPDGSRKRLIIGGGLLLIIAAFTTLIFVRSLCRVPSDKDVRRQFMAENPMALVLDVGVGEGDSEAAYFHIRYEMPGEGIKHEVVWLYQYADGSWSVTHRETTR